MPEKSIKLLLIEDSQEDALILREALEQEKDSPYTVIHVVRLEAGLKRLSEGDIDLILADLTLPDSKGLDTVIRIRRQNITAPLVVLTASDDDEIALQSLEQGAQDFLVKGYVQVYPTLLLRTLRYAVERKRSQEALRVAHQKTERLLSSLPSILIEVDANNRITHWNPVAEAVFKISAEDALNRSFKDAGIAWDAASLSACLEECRSKDERMTLDEVRFRRQGEEDGFLGVTLIPIQGESGQGTSVLLFGADITSRKHAEAEKNKLQTRLEQSQRMETIGRFAGGIAHDFNNFLQIILGFTGLIRARNQQDKTLLSDLHEVTHAAESASGLVQQLLAFSRRRPSQPRILEINEHMANMLRLIQQLVGSEIQVRLQLAAGSHRVKLDPTGIEQIIMNLCTNARDSMVDGGSLTITTEEVQLDAVFASTHSWAREGRFIRISVADTGSGMDPEVAARVFEPFFTTKKLGRGTGLGLAVVYGLVTQQEGFIDIETAPNRGTTFHLYFPQQVAPIAAKPQKELEADTTPFNGKDRQRILIVDDDASSGLLCSRMLEGTYETITTVESPYTALQILDKEKYDVLLSDIRMPDMDGFILSHEAKRVQPKIKVLLMTGSLTSDVQERLQSSHLKCEIVRKPFNANTLQKAILRCN